MNICKKYPDGNPAKNPYQSEQWADFQHTYTTISKAIEREKKEREKQQEEEEEGEATMVKEDIRSGLEGSEDKATENEYRKEKKV
ncbi:unnamed protein product [Pleuronectes platessa]|uniref:Uncharacterized protein n=1 Tax=Pleuronectes platessa TaxID=8262 RepID=A0A9N7THH4_PLEPL|nr:unnamed protein product [Pleuronectes platessa]